MDSPSSETTPNAISYVVPIKIEEEEKGSPKIEPSHSSEETITNAQPLDQEVGMNDQDEDREYGCRYCDKTFSNKQALGGHQNAHKVERTLEKTVCDVHQNGLGYLGSSSNSHFLTSYQRSHDFISRPFLSWPYSSQQHRNVAIGYNSRPGMPMTADPYGPRSIPGYNHVFTGWPAPVARLPQFLGPAQPQQAQPQPLSTYGLNQGLSLRFGEGSSSSARPVTDHHQSLTAFAGTWKLGPGGNLSRLGEQEVDESGLDLTLKL